MFKDICDTDTICKEILKEFIRQSYFNSGGDFKDSELILQDFIRRYTDETEHVPIKSDKSIIGPLGENFLKAIAKRNK